MDSMMKFSSGSRYSNFKSASIADTCDVDFWLRQEPKESRCRLSVRASVRDIPQISTPEEFLRVLKGLREGPKRGSKERA